MSEVLAPDGSVLIEYKVPEDIINKWIELEPDYQVPVPLTKGDLDSLFLGLLKTVYSIDALQNAVVAMKVNNDEAFGASLAWSVSQKVEAVNYVRHFMEKIMRCFVEKNDG